MASLRCLASASRASRAPATPHRLLLNSSASPSTSPTHAGRAFVAVRFNSASAAQPLDGERAITEKLRAKFGGKKLQVEDVSGGCGSFYSITLSSPLFKGLSTIKQHRLVNECLKEEVKDIHGLQLKTIPEE